MPANRINELLGNSRCIEGRMIRQYIHQYRNSIFPRLVSHGNKIGFRPQLIVPDSPFHRLIMIIPFSFSKDFQSAVVAHKTFIGRRSLHHCKPRIRNLLHIILNGLERPAKRVQDGPVLLILRQSGLLTEY